MNTTSLLPMNRRPSLRPERATDAQPRDAESVRAVRDLVTAIESDPALETGDDESFSGYAVLGLTFDSGHVLALRRFVASSIGPGYTSVWHRDARGCWTFYQDVLPRQGCSRYFGREVTENVVTPIQIEWLTSHHLAVHIRGDRNLHWQITLQSTPATVAFNWMGSRLADSWWQSPMVLGTMQAVARVSLHTGRLALTGRLPNGQHFTANPRLLWAIPESRARLNGTDLGLIKSLPQQARLGEFWIPQRGLFVIGCASMERFDATRHLSVFSRRHSGSAPTQSNH